MRSATSAALGLVEPSLLKAIRTAPTRWVTGLVDLECGRLLELVADHSRTAAGAGFRLGCWLAGSARSRSNPG